MDTIYMPMRMPGTTPGDGKGCPAAGAGVFPGGPADWQLMEEPKARAQTRHIPVIISTLKNRPEGIERAVGLQAAGHIAKPYMFSDLPERVKGMPGGARRALR